MNITDLGEKIEDIEENTTLQQFNTIYGGISLFHHFANNIDVIEMIHDKYIVAKADKALSSEQEYMPLVMLYPAPVKIKENLFDDLDDDAKDQLRSKL